MNVQWILTQTIERIVMTTENLIESLNDVVLVALSELNPSHYFLLALDVMMVAQKIQLIEKVLGADDAKAYGVKISKLVMRMRGAVESAGFEIISGGAGFYWSNGDGVGDDFFTLSDAVVDAYKRIVVQKGEDL